MTYDGLLRQVYGKPFDRKLFIIFFFNGIPNAFITCTIVMILFTPPNYRCRLPDYASDVIKQNSSLTNLTMDFFLPRDVSDDVSFSKCMKYNRTYEDYLTFLNNSEYNSNDTQSVTSPTISCEGDKEYFDAYGKISAVMEFDWTCDKSLVKLWAGSLYMGGISAGTAFGYLSDKFGRKLIFNAFTFLMSALMIILSLSNSIGLFLASMFVTGACSLVNYVSGFVLAMECTIPSRRNYLAISSFLSFSIGYGITSLIGFLAPDWRWHLRILGLCGVFFIPNLWLVVESPRWLLANGKVKEAKKVLKAVAKYNGKAHVMKNVEESIKEEAEKLMKEKQDTVETKKTSGIIVVFREFIRNPRMCLTFAIVAISWFTVSLAYYGISLSVQNLSGNLYLNNTLMGLVEIPGLVLAYLAVKWMSRPLSNGGFMLLSGVLIMVSALLSQVNGVVATVVSLIGKSLNSGAFYVIYIHTAEIFPTFTRNTLVSFASFAGRIGSITAPYFAYLGDLYGMYVPFLSLSIITCFSGIITLIGLPETNKVELPETMEDTLNLKLLISKSCCKKKNQVKAVPLNDERSALEENKTELF